MKFFLDTADILAIKKWYQCGIIEGVTTNPTHLSKAQHNPTQVVLQIARELADSDISVEVTEQDPELMYKQAHAIARLAPNIVVKIPCHERYYPVIKKLAADGVALNITLVFTLIQSLMMCKMGVKYISPFVGRLDDIDVSGVDSVAEIVDMIRRYGFATQVLAASIRQVSQVHDAIRAGADAITLPPALLEKMVQHPLTDSGMQTFMDDWARLGIKQFP